MLHPANSQTLQSVKEPCYGGVGASGSSVGQDQSKNYFGMSQNHVDNTLENMKGSSKHRHCLFCEKGVVDLCKAQSGLIRPAPLGLQ